MPNIVLIGNQRKVPFDLDHAVDMMSGGQGKVYFASNPFCAKIMYNPDASSVQLSAIHRMVTNSSRPYGKVASVAAIPWEMVWDEQGKKIIGFTMEQLRGWQSLGDILTEHDSQEAGIDSQASGYILEALSRAIRMIHAQRLVIGDLNPSNVLFRREGRNFLVKVIDVDSWSIYRKSDIGVEYASHVLDTGTIYPPDIILADRNRVSWPSLTPTHDWWSFAYIAWMVLTKYDPFMAGLISDADREDRILGGLTANCAASVKLQPEYGPAIQALGPKLRLHLDRCLRRKTKRPFPTKLLTEFAYNLRRCSKCSFTAHASAVVCPRCGRLL
jgi:DNA-binding helix-hairpin-helix protein with protein kinase domain